MAPGNGSHKTNLTPTIEARNPLIPSQKQAEAPVSGQVKMIGEKVSAHPQYWSSFRLKSWNQLIL